MVSTATTPKFKQRQQRIDNKLLLLRCPITSFEPTLWVFGSNLFTAAFSSCAFSLFFFFLFFLAWYFSCKECTRALFTRSTYFSDLFYIQLVPDFADYPCLTLRITLIIGMIAIASTACYLRRWTVKKPGTMSIMLTAAWLFFKIGWTTCHASGIWNTKLPSLTIIWFLFFLYKIVLILCIFVLYKSIQVVFGILNFLTLTII